MLIHDPWYAYMFFSDPLFSFIIGLGDCRYKGELQLLKYGEFYIHYTQLLHEQRVVLASEKNDESRYELSMCATTFYVVNYMRHWVSAYEIIFVQPYIFGSL